MREENLYNAVRELSLILFKSKELLDIESLEGDASTRQYLRANYSGGGATIFMVAKDKNEADWFIEMTNLMGKLEVETPKIFGSSENILALESLGSVLLQDKVNDSSDDELFAEYQLHLDDLINFQERSIACEDKSMKCFKHEFDVKKLMWEVEFTNEYYLKAYLKIQPGEKKLLTMNKEWENVADKLAEKMETLAHRDFHSRNIMLFGGRRVWIDYQDARMGRLTYDVASLLLDPYVDMPMNLSDKLADCYFEKLKERGIAPWDHDKFIDLYELSGLQRMYKALGTYGYQASSRKVDAYIPYMKPALATLKGLAERHPDTTVLGEILADVIE